MSGFRNHLIIEAGNFGYRENVWSKWDFRRLMLQDMTFQFQLAFGKPCFLLDVTSCDLLQDGTLAVARGHSDHAFPKIKAGPMTMTPLGPQAEP